MQEYDEEYQWNEEDLENYRSKMSAYELKSPYFSKKLTNIFSNTEVTVIKFISNQPITYNFPGDPNPSLSKDSIMKLPNFIATIGWLFGYVPYIAFFILTFIRYSPSLTGIAQNYRMYNTKDISIDPNTNKINCELDKTTVFVSSFLIDKFTEDEVTAIILHDIGENTQAATWAFTSLSKIPMMAIMAQLIKEITPLSTMTGDTQTPILDKIKNYGMILFILYYFVWFIIRYLSRKVDYNADEFAIKCGYGEALKTAITKLNSYNAMQNNFSAILNSGKIIGGLKILIKTLTAIMKAKTLHIISPEHPFNQDRLDFIEKKTNEYNNGLLT